MTWRSDDTPRSDALDGEGGLDLVLARAAVDRQFRLRLLDDPRSAITDILGIELAPRFRIRFIEKDPGVTVMIVLPDVIDGGQR